MDAQYCAESVCLRKVFAPHIYCDKHVDKSSTPPPPTDLMSLIDFVTDRFYGAKIDHKQLQNAISDHQIRRPQ